MLNYSQIHKNFKFIKIVKNIKKQKTRKKVT